MKLIKIALVGPDQMTPQIQGAIQTVSQWLNKLELGVPNQDFSSASGVQSSIGQLNELLRSNSDTRFVPIKSHSDLLVQTLELCLGKAGNKSLSQPDLDALSTSISNYKNDLSSIL
jgi:hypothetical protein